MEEEEDIPERIRAFVACNDVTPINRGYSTDKKFLCTSGTRKRFLVRYIGHDGIRDLPRRREEYDLVRILGRYSSLVPEPYGFYSSPESSYALMILEYIEGTDGEESLKDLNREDQYGIGYQAGEELKRLHRLAAPTAYPPWHILKKRKHAWYCREFLKNPVQVEGVDLDRVMAYVEENRYLLEGVSQTFLHDDLHPANLIIREGRLNGIIDFNRCDWGDPFHDLYKIAPFSRNISIPFSRGQVDGYFRGEVPPLFWKRYTLYGAMSIIADLVWSDRYDLLTGSRGELEKAKQRVRRIYSDHNGFSSVVPGWYGGNPEDR